jgi:M-phase inducer tyrosine phosphatase
MGCMNTDAPSIFQEKCEPRAYIPMDDPKHEQKRDSDLHDFRKFTRTRSFTYGENQNQTVRPSQPCPRLAFDVSSTTAARRVSVGKADAEPDRDGTMASPLSNPAHARLLADVLESPGADSTEGSPCARLLNSSSSNGGPLFGSTKTRLLGRAVGRSTFMRTSSYAGAPSRA